MDIFEFELRYKSYEGMSIRYKLGRDQAQILKLVQKTNGGQLDKALVETSVEDLHVKTKETYAQYKIDFIAAADTTPLLKHTDSLYSLQDYLERIEYEFKVIHEMGYNTYFLIVEDYIVWAKNNDIVVGPGRGSCAGSLLSYLIGITDIDPLQYDLIFERFLNPARISMPDIDTDFEDTQRVRVIDYITQKYGKDKVAHIGTYMTLAAKASFKDVARVMGVKFMDSNRIANMISEKTIQKSLDENEELRKTVDGDDRMEKIFDLAMQLEGTVRQTGVHACGMIIAPEPTANYSAIQNPPKSGSKGVRDHNRVVSQYDGGTIEDIGLLKMDLLGLRNLSIIKNTIKILDAKAKQEGKELNPLFAEFLDTMLFHPPLDDEHVYKAIFWKGDTSGVFQFESDGMKQWLKKLKPTEFDDLIAMVSLYRPGPMEFIPNYIDRKHGIEKVSYMQSDLRNDLVSKYGEEVAEEEKKKMEEDLTPLLGKTYGIAVYQEQLMRLVQSMAGFSMAEADKLRKGVGKKISSVIEALKKKFVEKGEIYRQYKPETTTWVYEKMIEPAARYSFNKSHAACYAYISYQTAYLKTHHPIEFHAALLRSVEEETDKLGKFIDEIKMQGYDIQLPDVNESYAHVAAIGDTIRLGFLSIKGVGSEVASQIQAERLSDGAYESLADFCKRCKERLSKKSVESLIAAGALDVFDDRHTLTDNISTILDWIKTLDSGGQQAGLFAMTVVEGSDLTLQQSTPYTLMEQLKTEFTVFKTFVSGHPMDGLYSFLRGKYGFISMFKDKENYGEFTCFCYIKSISRNRRGNGFFMVIEDVTGEFETYITDKMDLEPFMIVGISGYIGRRPRLDKISVFDLTQLREKADASGKLNPAQTVASVRSDRTKAQAIKKKPRKLIDLDEKSDAHVGGLTKSTGSLDNIGNMIVEPLIDEVEIADEPAVSAVIYEFALPDTMDQLMKLSQMLRGHPGDIEITVGSEKKLISEEGLGLMQEFGEV